MIKNAILIIFLIGLSFKSAIAADDEKLLASLSKTATGSKTVRTSAMPIDENKGTATTASQSPSCGVSEPARLINGMSVRNAFQFSARLPIYLDYKNQKVYTIQHELSEADKKFLTELKDDEALKIEVKESVMRGRGRGRIPYDMRYGDKTYEVTLAPFSPAELWPYAKEIAEAFKTGDFPELTRLVKLTLNLD